MPEPDHSFIKVSGAGVPDVNSVHAYQGMHDLRPWYGKRIAGAMTLQWIAAGSQQWLFVRYGEPDPWGAAYYRTRPSIDWCYHMLKAAWELGSNPETTLPLPVLEAYAGPGQPSATNLLTDDRVDPAHILNRTPTLGWTYIPADGGPVQGAYQIHVASSRLLLEAQQPDLWDSGIVESAAHQTIYAGKQLGDLQMYFWAVRVRDTSGVWSEDW